VSHAAIPAESRSESLPVVVYKLLRDAIVDRLRRMEANSLVTNFLLLAAFHFPFLDFAVRMLVTFVLNTLVYFINDFIDVEIDLAAENKDHRKALYIQRHKKTAFALIVCLSAGLILSTLFYSRSVCFGVILALWVIFLYTDYFKNMPFLDVFGCFVWGVAMAWAAIPDFSAQGVRLILLIGLFTACFEIVQCVKDYEFDKKFQLRTTPIVIGIPKAFWLLRALLVAASLYAVFVLGFKLGFLLLLPIFFRTDQRMEIYWMKLRVVFGVVWLALMVRQFLGSAG
jgi:4-hydroxybenzoate polyprenyltransferase